MSGYSELKNAIKRVVKTNNNREITGQNLQNTLTSMVNSLGANYHFAGFASPSTNPGTPDQNIFYIASEEGTYVNFNRIILESGLSFLMWNGQWSSQTVSVGEVTKSWVQQNYVSIAFFNELFELYNGNTKIPVNGNIPVDKSKLNIKAMFGFWTEQYISALGKNGSGSSGGGGVDMTTVWSALAGNTDEQINKSHLTTALNGYATTSWVSQNFATLASIPTKVSQLVNDEGFITRAALPTNVSQLINDEGFITSAALPTNVSQLINDEGFITSAALPTNVSQLINDAGFVTASIVDGYATQNWVGQNYLSIAFFNRLFQTYNGTTRVNANDTTSTIDNIKAMFGFWTEQYISALGKNTSGGGGGGDIDMTTVWSAMANNTNEQINLSHLTTALSGYASQSWVYQQLTGGTVTSVKVGNTSYSPTDGVVSLPAYPSTLDNIADGSTRKLADYLPLSGGTLTGLLTVSSTGSSRATIHLVSAADVPNDLYFGSHGVRHWSLTSRSSGEGHIFYLYNNIHSGYATLTFYDDNRAVFSNSVTASSFIKSNGTSLQFLKADGSVDSNSYATQTWVGQNYIPLSGGTITGTLNINASSGRSTLSVVTPSNQPCDLWLGANNLSTWSLTCRGSSESYNFGIYSNTAGAANNGHVVAFNTDGRAHFYNSIHAALHLCVGSNVTTYNTSRAELDIITPSNNASELWYGVGGSRYWSICCRASDENYIYAFYSNVSNGYKATLDHNGNFYVSSSLTAANIELGNGNEINSTSSNHNLYLNYRVSGIVSLGVGGGNVGVGTSSPSYKLHVAGVIYSTTGIFSDGYVSALGQNTSSDIRKKDIKENIALSVDDIAAAPMIKYEWKDNRDLGMQVGSIAQYWESVLPESIHDDKDGFKSMQYGVIALLSSISVARKVQDHERRIKDLEKECERLRTEVEQLRMS